MKTQLALLFSFTLAAAGVTWFSQDSINAYWQQTYHQTSPLEALAAYPEWTTGAKWQQAANEQLGSLKNWIDAQNEQLPVNIAAAQEAARREAEAQAAARREAERQAALRQAEQARAAQAAQASQKQPEKPVSLEKAVLRQGDVVFFTGDSLMQGVAPFVQQTLKQQYGITSINLSKQSTGLSYPNFFDWPLTIEQTFKENPNIRLVVMFLGANDPWDFPNPKGGAYLKFQSPEWEAEYLNRVNRILNVAQQHNAQVIWLGLPYMKKKKLDEQMRYLDKLFSTHLKDKVFWIPTAGLLSNGGTEYSDSVEVGGKIVRYRSKDGIHFSIDGQKLLAQTIMQKIEFAQP